MFNHLSNFILAVITCVAAMQFLGQITHASATESNASSQSMQVQGEPASGAKISVNVQDLLELGQSFIDAGNLDKAIEVYSKVIQSGHKGGDVFEKRAIAFIMKGDHDHAIEDLNEVLRLNPKDARAYNNRGAEFRSKGEIDRAAADFSEAIRLEPSYTRAYYNRGGASMDKGDFDQAIKDFDVALKLDSSVAGGYMDRGLAYLSKSDFDRAIADFNEASRLEPQDLAPINSRGIAYAAKGDVDHAIRDFSSVIEAASDEAAPYLNRGSAYQRKNDLERALVDFEAALRIQPDLQPALESRDEVKKALEVRKDAGSTKFGASSTLTPSARAASPAKAIDGPHPDHVWGYDNDKKSAWYGTPESSDIILSITCKGGEIYEAYFAYGYDALNQGRKSGDRAPLTLRHKDGAELKITGVARRDEVMEEGNWDLTFNHDAEHPILNQFERSGTVDIIGPYELRIATKGARQAIEKVRKACSPAQTAVNNSTVSQSSKPTPSFDCSKAKAADEVTICSDSRLAELDRIIAKGFSIARAQGESEAQDMFASVARVFLSVRKACGSDRLCILDRQDEQIGFYESSARYHKFSGAVESPEWVKSYRQTLYEEAVNKGTVIQTVPEKVGQCTTTVVAAFSDRFGNPLPKTGHPDAELNGVRIYFSNGGSQVSYGRDAPIIRSKVGDKVRMCLTSIPKNCPPGDDRGRIYKSTNLRTGGSWSLTAEQHMCGGA